MVHFDYHFICFIACFCMWNIFFSCFDRHSQSKCCNCHRELQKRFNRLTFIIFSKQNVIVLLLVIRFSSNSLAGAPENLIWKVDFQSKQASITFQQYSDQHFHLHNLMPEVAASRENLNKYLLYFKFLLRCMIA